MKHHRLQLRGPFFQAHLLIFSVVKPGIFKPGAHHPGIAGRHQLEIPGNGVGHRHKVAQQIALIVGYGKIALVLFDDRNQELGRQLEVFFLEFPHERLRKFDQLRHFIQEFLIFQDLPADGARCCLNAFSDNPLAFFQIDQDKMLLQILPVTGIIGHRQPGGAHKPVAKGAIAALDIPIGKVDHFATQKRHQ